MRFNEFNEGLESSWYAKPAIDPDTYIEKPAYQRAGKPEPITRPVPGTKPTVNLADPKQAATYNANINAERTASGKPAVWTNNRTGVTSSRPPNANYRPPEHTIDRLGSFVPGEPPMGPNINTAVKAGAEAGAEAGAKSIGKKVLGKVIPGAGVALDAEEAYRRYQKGDRTGSVISALGAAGGLVPGFGPAISFGAAGVNAARDMMPDKPYTSSNSVINKANAQAANKGMTGRGGQSQAKPNVATPKTTPAAPVQQAPANVQSSPAPSQQAPVAPVQQAPAQSSPAPATRSATSSTYKGTAGAQAIQQANADKIKNVNDIRAGDTIKVGGQDYTIKPGDTLDNIAKNQQSSTTTAQTNTSTLPNTTTNEPEEKPDDQLSNVIPNDNMAEETKSLSRIKSLAGLK